MVVVAQLVRALDCNFSIEFHTRDYNKIFTQRRNGATNFISKTSFLTADRCVVVSLRDEYWEVTWIVVPEAAGSAERYRCKYFHLFVKAGILNYLSVSFNPKNLIAMKNALSLRMCVCVQAMRSPAGLNGLSWAFFWCRFSCFPPSIASPAFCKILQFTAIMRTIPVLFTSACTWILSETPTPFG